MQFQKLALLSIAGYAAAAKLEKKQDLSDPVAISVLNVLVTALPQSLLEIGFTNQPAVASIIASEFAAGNTPEWYSQLPSDVQSYLTAIGESLGADIPTPTGDDDSTPDPTGAPTAQETESAASESAASESAASESAVSESAASESAASQSGRTTSIQQSQTGSAGAASGTSTGGAALPTAVIGTGVAGLVAFVGMLAL